MKTILLFNCKENLATALSFLNYRVIMVEQTKQNYTLGQLIEGQSTTKTLVQCASAFTDEMAVFAEFEDDDLDTVLALLKSTGNGHILKAIVTPVNINWPAALLYRELCSERDAIRKMNSSKQ